MKNKKNKKQQSKMSTTAKGSGKPKPLPLPAPLNIDVNQSPTINMGPESSNSIGDPAKASASGVNPLAEPFSPLSALKGRTFEKPNEIVDFLVTHKHVCVEAPLPYSKQNKLRLFERAPRPGYPTHYPRPGFLGRPSEAPGPVFPPPKFRPILGRSEATVSNGMYPTCNLAPFISQHQPAVGIDRQVGAPIASAANPVGMNLVIGGNINGRSQPAQMDYPRPMLEGRPVKYSRPIVAVKQPTVVMEVDEVAQADQSVTSVNGPYPGQKLYNLVLGWWLGPILSWFFPNHG